MEPETNDRTTPRSDAGHNGEGSETLAALRRFARPRPVVERCELCGAELGGDHPHLLDRSSRQIACSCDACAILFCGQEGAKFLRVPRRLLKLEAFRFTDGEWDALTLPINLAFFLRGKKDETTVLYPSPAGVMESTLEMPQWQEFFGSNMALASVEPEVEALLINRIGDQQAYYVVPIDAGYRLVGIIRTQWRGLSGGPAVWQAISEFFAALQRQATPVGEALHA
jgi:hypothetical protein